MTFAFAALTAMGLVGNVKLAGSASAADSGDWVSAQRLARAASRWQPWSAEPFFLLGEMELATGDRSAARRSFSDALERDSQDWRTWYELARVSPAARHDAIVEIAELNPLAVRRTSR
jgi:predicted Zn-dependent protease